LRARRNEPMPKPAMIRMKTSERTTLKSPSPVCSYCRHVLQVRGIGTAAKTRNTNPITSFQRMWSGRMMLGITWRKNCLAMDRMKKG